MARLREFLALNPSWRITATEALLQLLAVLLFFFGAVPVVLLLVYHEMAHDRKSWAAAANMAITCCISIAGGAAATLRSLGLLNAHVSMLALLMSAQLCLGTAAIVKTQEQQGDVLDPRIKIGLAVYMGFEALVLTVGCLLSAAYAHVEEVAEDLATEAGEDAQRPLLGGGRQGVHAPAPADDEWSERMRTVYGVDMSQYTYRPRGEAGPGQVPRLGPSRGAQEGASRCAIM